MDFEDIVFNSLVRDTKAKKSRVACPVKDDFDRFLKEETLRFSGLKKRGCRIASTSAYEYDLSFAEPILASEIYKSLQDENPADNFVFTEEYNNFSPDEALIKKSKAPLWVLSASNDDNTAVKIKRIFN